MGGYHVPDFPDHGTGGVKAMSIQGRLVRERERIGVGMTPEERKWRKQWILDQRLAPHEPVHVPELYRELHNPIKRLYRAPLDIAFRPLNPVLGPTLCAQVRYVTGKMFMFAYLAVLGVYWVKYNSPDWTRYNGFRFYTSKMRVLPGEPGYPSVSTKTGTDYNDRGFKSSPIYK